MQFSLAVKLSMIAKPTNIVKKNVIDISLSYWRTISKTAFYQKINKEKAWQVYNLFQYLWSNFSQSLKRELERHFLLFISVYKSECMYSQFSCHFRLVYTWLFPNNKRASIDGLQLFLMQCRDAFRWFNTFQIKHFHLNCFLTLSLFLL